MDGLCCGGLAGPSTTPSGPAPPARDAPGSRPSRALGPDETTLTRCLTPARRCSLCRMTYGGFDPFVHTSRAHGAPRLWCIPHERGYQASRAAHPTPLSPPSPHPVTLYRGGRRASFFPLRFFYPDPWGCHGTQRMSGRRAAASPTWVGAYLIVLLSY